MILINFSHPITDEQRRQLESMTGSPIEETIRLAPHFDGDTPFAHQVRKMVDELDLPPEIWEGQSILINPPSFNFIAVALLAELHGRMGYFPATIRLNRIDGSLPPRFEIAEIINLQQIRDQARKNRAENSS